MMARPFCSFSLFLRTLMLLCVYGPLSLMMKNSRIFKFSRLKLQMILRTTLIAFSRTQHTTGDEKRVSVCCAKCKFLVDDAVENS